jgi:hypothetical protein
MKDASIAAAIIPCTLSTVAGPEHGALDAPCCGR